MYLPRVKLSYRAGGRSENLRGVFPVCDMVYTILLYNYNRVNVSAKIVKGNYHDI
jgi:hypothetical protein